MNHHVPDFEMEDDYSIPASSARAGKSTMSEDEIMELVWHNGQLVMHSQSQRPAQKRSKYDVVIPEHITAPAAPPQPQPETQPQLFMHEDEMASWLHYPLNDDDSFCSDLLYNNSSNVQTNDNNTTANPPSAPPRPPVHPPPTRSEAQNFLLFSRLNNNNNNNKSRFDSAAAAPRSVVRETTTVVDSSDTPLVGPGSRATESRLDNNASPGISMSRGGGKGLATATTATAATAGKDALTCEMSLTSSPGGGSTSASGSLSAEMVSTQKPPPPPVDRKRKGREREPDDAECQSEDVEFESGSAKKVSRGSSSTKRSRAAEVHNLSERRRRDRINEKMRTLQELIPRCNKSDKASMLEEAIEYLKSLQLQVQMMSMGCGMVPMMFSGVQPYMPMGMARMGMGMGMGMEMGMNRPMMPYGNVLSGSPMPTAAAAAHMGPRFPMPAYQMQTMLPNDPNRVQATNQSEPMSNPLGTESQNQTRGPNFADPYQQYFTPQQMQMQMQMQLHQNQAMAQPSSNQPSSSMGPENQESHQ